MTEDRIHRYLDGELSREELPEEARHEAEAWERMLEDVAATTPPGAPAGLEARIRRALEAEWSRRSPAWRRALAWLLRPRSVRISPALGLAAAAALALLVWRPWSTAPGAGPAATVGASREAVAATGAGAATVYVEFSLRAPGATSVAVAGDFSSWKPRVSLQDPDGDGVWTGRVPLHPGIHQYMFVIDGSRWVTDPQAHSYDDDGFGNRNAVLAVPATRGT